MINTELKNVTDNEVFSKLKSLKTNLMFSQDYNPSSSKNDTSKRSVLDAFLLGFVIYGVFDLTNLAIFKKYDNMVALMDMLWGGTLFALTAYIIYQF